jgi:hypothetical protein
MLNPENEIKDQSHTHCTVNYPHKHTEHIQGGLP